MENLIKGIKVNGTSYQIDYASTANRPFGVETREVIIPTQEVELPLSNGPATTNLLINITAGENYIVTWDGQEYICKAVENNGGKYVLVENYESETPIFAITINNATIPTEIDFYGEQGNHTFKVEHATISKITVDDIGPIYINGCKPFTLKEAMTIIYNEYMNNSGSEIEVENVTTENKFGYIIIPEQTLIFSNNNGGSM